jgi:hypothetical protein
MSLNSEQRILVDAYKTALNGKDVNSILAAGNPISDITRGSNSIEEFYLIGQIVVQVKDYINTFLKNGGSYDFETWLKSYGSLYVGRWRGVIERYPLYTDFEEILGIVASGLVSTNKISWKPPYVVPAQSNLEFESAEIGFIGAIKNSNGIQPLGRALRLLNIKNTSSQFELGFTKTITSEVIDVTGKTKTLVIDESATIEVFFVLKDNLIYPQQIDTDNILKKLSDQYNDGIERNNITAYDSNKSHIPPFASRLKPDESEKKYQSYHYKTGFLTEASLGYIESETRISRDFLRPLQVLWLEQENYPDEITLSHLPIFTSWPKGADGVPLDVIEESYTNLWKSPNIRAKFAFLVDETTFNGLKNYTDRTFSTKSSFSPKINNIFKYELNILPLGAVFPSTDPSTTLGIASAPKDTFNPTTFIQNLTSLPTYGPLVEFVYKDTSVAPVPSSDILNNWLVDDVVRVIANRQIYKKRPNVTDDELVDDIVSSQLFLEIFNLTFKVNNIQMVRTDAEHLALSDQIKIALGILDTTQEKWKTINIKLLNLLQRYIDFVKLRGYLDILFFMVDTNEFEIITGLRVAGDEVDDLGRNPRTYVPAQEDTFIDLDIAEDWIPNAPYIFKGLSRAYDYIPNLTSLKTRGMFTCIGERMKTFFTGSTSVSHSKYFIPVYDKLPEKNDSYHHFDISYAHINGSGSTYTASGVDLLPAKTIYKKYMMECFGSTAGKFKFKNDKEVDYFYVIQFDRNDFKDRIDPGNIQLTFCPLSSSANQLVNTGSNFFVDQTRGELYTLIDDSGDGDESQSADRYIQDHYYLISGSIQEGAYDDDNKEAWGVIFPKSGIMVLDGTVLDQSCSFNTVTASIDGDNNRKLFLSISGSCSSHNIRTIGGSWYARSTEEYMRETYNCRVHSEEFNYSNNYTYHANTSGSLKYYSTLTPFTYITSIGLYNSDGDLVAVGKTRKPLKKDVNTEYVFQVRVRLN